MIDKTNTPEPRAVTDKPQSHECPVCPHGKGFHCPLCWTANTACIAQRSVGINIPCVAIRK